MLADERRHPGQIDEIISKQISDHPQIKAQLKELRDREDAIPKLQSARTGPTSALLELSRILTPGRGPDDRPRQDRAAQARQPDRGRPNPNWDPRRLWLTTYNEIDRVVKMGGLARDGEDVTEFLRRLTLSDYFTT